MLNKKNRHSFTVNEYLKIRGKILGREDGERRKYIEENFIIKDNEFIEKKVYDKNLIKNRSALVIASKDPADDKEAYFKFLATNMGFISEVTRTMGEKGNYGKTVFSTLQAIMMDGTWPFMCCVKSRQFGFSWMLAARALAKAMLKKKHTTIFVSYNEEESKEKIVFARDLYDSMPKKWQIARKLKYDNKTSLVFEKIGRDGSETRILSYPQRIIRGKGGEVDIGLDEAAHCIHLTKIYTSALPALSRSKSSTLWMGSSPAGKSGLFHSIMSNENLNYGTYVTMNIPWWVIPEFCIDVETARKNKVWDMHTDERVALYANDRLKLIRASSVIDDFKQEYECEYLDEAYSYYPWDLINSCVPIGNLEGDNTPDYDAPGQDLEDGDKSKAGVGIDYYTNFDEFMFAILSGKIKGSILGGFDVGRTTDASEISYLEEDPKTNHQIVRCIITLKNVSLPKQKTIVMEQINSLGSKLIKFGIDANGIGLNIAEDIEALSYELVVKHAFNSNAWKEEACRRFKFRMETKKISFPTDRKFLNQIHSIKRTLLSAGTWRFDVEKNRLHHGDKFWSVIAASEVGQRIIGNGSNSVSFEKRITGNPINPYPSARSMITEPHSFASQMKHSPWGGIGGMGSGAFSLAASPSSEFAKIVMNNGNPFSTGINR